MPDADYEALVIALREMPDQMAQSWGRDAAWFTSGAHVAELVREWLTETIEDSRVIPSGEDES